ncbi:MAG: hypothetical protein JWO38_2709 [Gemmataceae bacterium]|nr:hypothetical protein [Gemmataceae bacterium]
MSRNRKGTSTRRQGTVQLCGFAVTLNRQTARALTENKKITASAAVLAFARLTPDEQVRLCTEARKRHAAEAPPATA